MELNFEELACLIGQRIDSPGVLNFAASLNVKPPKPTTDGDWSAAFVHKASSLEVSWSHRVHHPDFYPPRKENRRWVSYVTSIWFKPARLHGLPGGITGRSAIAEIVALFGDVARPQARGDVGVEEIVIPLQKQLGMHLVLPVEDGCLTDENWILSFDEYRCHASSRSTNTLAFAPWRLEWPAEQADLPTGFFLAWCIAKGAVGERHLAQHPDLVAAVKERRMTGREFFYKTAFAGEFWSWDVSPELQEFTRRYFACLCNRNSTKPLLGRADRCGPDDDFMAVFGPHFPAGGLQAADDWVNQERFALLLEARLEDFRLTGLKTDIPSELSATVKVLYMRYQKQMAAMPPPVEAQFLP